MSDSDIELSAIFAASITELAEYLNETGAQMLELASLWNRVESLNIVFTGDQKSRGVV
jgi:hypothetical protein